VTASAGVMRVSISVRSMLMTRVGAFLLASVTDCVFGLHEV